MVSRKFQAADLTKALLMADLHEQYNSILKRVIGAVSEELRHQMSLIASADKVIDIPGYPSY